MDQHATFSLPFHLRDQGGQDPVVMNGVSMTNVPSTHNPLYPEPFVGVDADLRSFFTEFYQLYDNMRENERWVQSFTRDAHVQMGGDKAKGTEEIRALRGRMWTMVQDRKHIVSKVFPGQFAGIQGEPECMLLGSASFRTRDGRTFGASWTAHAVLRRVSGEWKFARYQVWAQNDY